MLGIRELTPSQADTLTEFLKRELAESDSASGCTDLTDNVIDVGSSPAIQQRCYMTSPKVLESMNAEVDKMLTDDVIELSNSDWSPLL